jgi:hypothetical protein
LTPLTNTPSLKERAEQLASRITGLLEPLRLIEVDDTRSVAQLRSQNPLTRDDERFYYEVMLQGDGTTQLRRFQAVPAPRTDAGKRQQVAFTLTHEALAKFVADLTNLI